MEKIISIHERIEHQRFKSQQKKYRKKIDTLHRITQCSSCHFKCAMCGKYLESADSCNIPEETDNEYTFCDGCQEEFNDFLALCRGEKIPHVFWHNREWKKMWAAWLRYQRAINEFLDSREFDMLLEEIDNQP